MVPELVATAPPSCRGLIALYLLRQVAGGPFSPGGGSSSAGGERGRAWGWTGGKGKDCSHDALTLAVAGLQGLRGLEPEKEEGPDGGDDVLALLERDVRVLPDWGWGVAMLPGLDRLGDRPAWFAGALPEITGCLTTPIVGCWLVNSLLFSCPV
jgi:hypothetical protein